MRLAFRTPIPFRRPAKAALVAVWLLAAGAGTWWLAAESALPGASGRPMPQWPATSMIKHGPERLMLVMFLHPRCACSRATLAELARVMSRCNDRVRATVLFYRPAQATPLWEVTDLWRQAAVIPGVAVGWDEGGEEASRFGARTSGHGFVFDAAGTLRFHGGITGARGHEGDNAGSAAVLALARGNEPAHGETPVFGCALAAPPGEEAK